MLLVLLVLVGLLVLLVLQFPLQCGNNLLLFSAIECVKSGLRCIYVYTRNIDPVNWLHLNHKPKLVGQVVHAYIGSTRLLRRK